MLEFPSDDREVFERRFDGRFHCVDTCSDADDILAKFQEDRGDLRFRITYSGELKSGSKKPRREEKDRIRWYISDQLKELRGLHPVFGGIGLTYEPPWEPPPPNMGYAFPDLINEPSAPRPRPAPIKVSKGNWWVRSALAAPINVNGRLYVPLVRKSFATMCGLDILFLRKDGPGPLVGEGGDLDNRVKTLFDGLRVPKLNEVDPPASGAESNEITYCLLEDDALVTDFSVRTDRLLTHPGAAESQVLLIIDVAVRVSHLTSDNLGFLSE